MDLRACLLPEIRARTPGRLRPTRTGRGGRARRGPDPMEWTRPSRRLQVAYRLWGQMKVLQLAKVVRELSPMNSVAE
jgi:hypothetical protein